MNPLDWRFQIEPLEDVGKEFKEEHGRIGHDTKTNLEHDRVRVHVDQLVPYEPRPTEVEQESNDEKQVAKECRQHRRPHHAVQALYVEEIDRPYDAEPAGGQHHAAQAIESDPEAPRELIRHVRNCAQAVQIANIGGV